MPERSSAVERTLVGEHRLADIVAVVADRPVAVERMTAVEEHTFAVDAAEEHTTAVVAAEEHTTAVEPLAEPRLVPTFVLVVETMTGFLEQPTVVRQHNYTALVQPDSSSAEKLYEGFDKRVMNLLFYKISLLCFGFANYISKF